MKLEDIIKNTCNLIIKNYIPSSLGIFGLLESLTNNSTHTNTALSCLSYFILSTINDYKINKKFNPVENELIKVKENKLSNFVDFTINNPNLVGGIAFGITSYAGFELFKNLKVPPADFKELYFTYFLSLTPILATSTSLLVRNYEKIKKIKSNIKKIKTNTAEKIWNFAFEHPILVSSIYPLYKLNEFLENHSYKLNNKNNPFNSTTQYLLTPGTVTASMILLSSLTLTYLGGIFHGSSIRYWKNKLSKVYNKVLKNNDKIIEKQKNLLILPGSIENKIESLIELGNLYYENDKRKAFDNYKKALKLFNKKSSEISFIDNFKKSIWYERKINSNNTGNILLSLLNEDKKEIKNLELKITRENYELKYLYGKALEIAGDEIEGNNLKLEAVLDGIETNKIKKYEESKNIIIKFNDEILNEQVILKKNTRENLENELIFTKAIKEVIRNEEKYYVANPIGIINIDKSNFYVAEYADGKELYELINKELLSKAVDFMGLVHAKINYKGENRNYIKIIKDKLNSVNIKEEIIDSICNNLYPCIESFDILPKVCNLDAHPKNWIIDEDDIIMIDKENPRPVPPTFDTSNLLDFKEGLSLKEKYEIVNRHRLAIRNYGGSWIKKDFFNLAYLNSTIERALEFRGSINYSFVWDIMLKNSLIAIEEINKNFPNYYNKYKEQYNNLEKSINLICDV